jgi:hypothetical protein
MPIVEIGFFGGKDQDFNKKPKILITAGMDGRDQTAMTAAMNLIKFIGTHLSCLLFTLLDFLKY